jgi:hypothetical protein
MRDVTWECAMRLALSRWLEGQGYRREALAVTGCRMSVVRTDPGAHLHVIVIAQAGILRMLRPVARLGDWWAPRGALDDALSQYLSGEAAVLHFRVVETVAA